MNMRRKFYPEVDVGGYTRRDGTIDFYTRVSSLLDSSSVVLDFGAGRGAAQESGRGTIKERLVTMKGRVAQVIGVDVDPVVLTNPLLDQAYVLDVKENSLRLPLDDCSIDLIVADWVFEHIQNADVVAAELNRVLKPGGWICARTPNKWGYISAASRLIPEKLHTRILSVLQPNRRSEDIFPTYYRMNTRIAINRLWPKSGFSVFIIENDPEPSYAGESAILWYIFLAAARLAPPVLSPGIFIFIKKNS